MAQDSSRLPAITLGRAAVMRPMPGLDPRGPPMRRHKRHSSIHYSVPYVEVQAKRPQIWAPEGKRPALMEMDTCDDSIFFRKNDMPYQDPAPLPPASAVVRLVEPEQAEPEPEVESEAEELGLDADVRPATAADSELWPAVTDLESGLFDARPRTPSPSKLRPRSSSRRGTDRAEEGRPRRMGRSVYDAMETHGHFGLVDGGETSATGVCKVILHVPKRNRGYALDIRPGEIIYANSAKGKPIGGRLEVAYVSRHKYTPPGHAVTTCAIGIPEYQWRRFRD